MAEPGARRVQARASPRLDLRIVLEDLGKGRLALSLPGTSRQPAQQPSTPAGSLLAVGTTSGPFTVDSKVAEPREEIASTMSRSATPTAARPTLRADDPPHRPGAGLSQRAGCARTRPRLGGLSRPGGRGGPHQSPGLRARCSTSSTSTSRSANRWWRRSPAVRQSSPPTADRCPS